MKIRELLDGIRKRDLVAIGKLELKYFSKEEASLLRAKKVLTLTEKYGI